MRPGLRTAVQRRWRSMAMMWAAAGAVVAYVILVEDESLGSIGWTAPGRRDVRLAVVAFAGGLLLFALIAGALRQRGRGSPNDQVLASAGQRSVSLIVAASITAGVTEEVLFRGFSVERLGDAVGSYAAAGAVTLLVFTLAHVPRWGWATSAAIVGPGAALTWLYVATRNLPVCIAIHVVNDLWAYLLAPRLLARRSRESVAK